MSSAAANPSPDLAAALRAESHAARDLDPRTPAHDGPLDPVHAEPVPESTRPDTSSLTHRTAAGLTWLLAQAVGSKLIGFASQLILAAILIPEQFGIYTFALGIATLINVLQHAGVGEILIHRHRRLDLWTNPAVWLSASLGVVAMLAVLAAAPIAALIRPEPNVARVVALVSITALLSALAIVPAAVLQVQMRQRAIGIVALVSTITGALVSVTLAWRAAAWGVPALGGPVALALGAIASGLWQTTALWSAARDARAALRPSPQLRRWRFMIADSLRLLASGVINTLTSQGATLILGVLHSIHVVGVFSFGFILSLQSVALLQTSLNAVLFPALSKLQQSPARLLGAYVRSSRLLAIVGMPACFLQAAAAEPVMRVLFAERWLEAVPVVQFLSIGMAFGLLGSINTSLIKAQGKFDLLVKITIAYGLTYLLATALGGFLGEHVAMSVAICAYMILWGPLGALIAVRTVGGGIRHILAIYGSPGLMAAASVSLAYVLGSQLPASSKADFAAQAIVMTVIAAAAHALLVRLFARDALTELLERLDAVAPAALTARVRRTLWM
ncbi:MAG: oligosaccharide flippase family protein [Phycisphaeraceae bacterium]|nr:oligosaccharide flippase family protein [Phycisphaeraceae bacterium]